MRARTILTAAVIVAALGLAAPAVARVDSGMAGTGTAGTTGNAPAPAVTPLVAALSEVAGRPVTVECDGADELRARVGWALAYVVLDGSSTIHAGPTVCGWLAHPDTPTFGEGLQAVVHEAFHLRWNSVDESRVNCAALAAMPDLVARHFGGLDASTVLWGAHRLFDMTPDNYRRCA